ncbi:MAG: DUF4328 domain-containing protein [Pseudonocardia sp.]|nr:DUF4328 domain-containing protein [Pseudonocardia sp.]
MAQPPPSAVPPTDPPRSRAPYAGAPRYRFPPRWGFPARAWVPPPSDVVGSPGLPPAAHPILGTAVPLLWATAVVSALAAAAETWRYALLLASRSDALESSAVAASDAFVTSAGTIAPILAAAAGALLVLWTVRATHVAAERAGVRPSRSSRMLVVGWLLPGLNLAVPGAVLAEIEHTALGRPAGQRPRPSRLVLLWWVLWASGVVLSAVVLAWSLLTGVQARADGVLLHAVLDLLAAVTAGVTAVVMTRLTRLLAPARPVRRELLVLTGPRRR